MASSLGVRVPNMKGMGHAFKYEGEPDIPAGETVREYRLARPKRDRAPSLYLLALTWGLFLLSRTRRAHP